MQKLSIKSNSGITMIALMIAIILMLIVVGVTIELIVPDKIFNYAKESKTVQENLVNYQKEMQHDLIEQSRHRE